MTQGQRSYMEDDFFISKDGCFAAVYDGHGGAAVSKYLRQNLHAQVSLSQPSFCCQDLELHPVIAASAENGAKTED